MANLDPRTASKVLRLLLQLNKDLGITLIIATHDLDLVPLFADKICVLNKGADRSPGATRRGFFESRYDQKHGSASAQNYPPVRNFKQERQHTNKQAISPNYRRSQKNDNRAYRREK